MRLRKTAAAMAIAVGVACSALTGCDFILTPTKVANGERYQSGDGRYDAYFAAVHQEQVASANWPDDSKAARKPIVTALDLRPGASNGTILAATRGKKGEGSLGSAVLWLSWRTREARSAPPSNRPPQPSSSGHGASRPPLRSSTRC